MPYRVGYAIPVQGFRPETHPGRAAGLLGLRGMGDSNTFSGCVQGYDANGNPVACSDPSASVWMDANGNAVAAGTPTGGASSPSPTVSPAAGVPTGSVLAYRATVGAHAWTSESSVVAGIEGTLAANGLQVVSESTGSATGVGNFAIQLQLQVTGAGFARPQDAQSIADHAVYVQTGNMPLSSSIAVQTTPSTPGASVPISEISSLPTLNWNTVILGVAALVVGAIVVRSVV